MSTSSVWLPTKAALKELCISSATLNRRKAEGYFKLGREYVKTGPNKTSICHYNIDACRKVMGTWLPPDEV